MTGPGFGASVDQQIAHTALLRKRPSCEADRLEIATADHIAGLIRSTLPGPAAEAGRAVVAAAICLAGLWDQLTASGMPPPGSWRSACQRRRVHRRGAHSSPAIRGRGITMTEETRGTRRTRRGMFTRRPQPGPSLRHPAYRAPAADTLPADWETWQALDDGHPVRPDGRPLSFAEQRTLSDVEMDSLIDVPDARYRGGAQ